MRKCILLFLAIVLCLSLKSQISNLSQAKDSLSQLSLKYELLNPSGKIKNGEIKTFVQGGIPPYKYYWSAPFASDSASLITGVTEGVNYSVKIVDAAGSVLFQEFMIEPESIDEKINSGFTPVVKAIESVIMHDIFASLSFYDPKIKDVDGNYVYHPNGTNKTMKIPLVVFWLIFGALLFTISMGFVNIRGFKHAIDLVRGRFDKPDHKGEVSHFQALSTALSATVGLGNIAGVAIAISIGGPGATLWMILAGFLGMSSKFVECTLGVKYRKINVSGEVSGGPMYYLSTALANKGLGWLGKFLAFVFAILVVGGSLGGGNMFQANQSFSQFATIFPSLENYGAYYGVLLAILVGVVIIGGIKGIARVTEKIVPFMAFLYVAIAIVIIVMNIDHAGNAIKLIWNGAFAPDALKGGVLGVLIVGFQRAAFSNEAGVGSASIAHSAAITDEPISEGIVALLEPFIDTIIICTMTALVIIFTGFYTPDKAVGLEGAELTSRAFGSVFSWFPYILLIAIFLFAFSTMISWSYYGLKGFSYLFGGIFTKFTANPNVIKYTYYVIFLFFIIVGSSSSLGAVVDFSDFMILGMAFPNIMGLIILVPEVRRDLKRYFAKIKNGEIKRFK